MKKFKMMVSFVLVIAILSSVSISCFAATPPTHVINQFRNFQYIEQGHSSTYVRILQRFLLHYNWTTGNYITVNGGVDGSFGLGTYYATYEFQKAVFSSASQWDGKVGSNTWEQICRAMNFVDASTEGTIYYFYYIDDNHNSNLILQKISNAWRVLGGDGNTYSIYT